MKDSLSLIIFFIHRDDHTQTFNADKNSKTFKMKTIRNKFVI